MGVGEEIIDWKVQQAGQGADIERVQAGLQSVGQTEASQDTHCWACARRIQVWVFYVKFVGFASYSYF